MCIRNEERCEAARVENEDRCLFIGCRAVVQRCASSHSAMGLALPPEGPCVPSKM